MFRLGKTISWIFLVVFFVALAAIATTFYEADKEEQAEIKNNQLLKKGRETIDIISDFAGSLAAKRAEEELVGRAGKILKDAQEIASNTDSFLPQESMDKLDYPQVSPALVSENALPALNDLMGDSQVLIDEGKDILTDKKSLNWKESLSDVKFWEYRKTDNGAELILSSKDSQEYIIPLPFKFLSEK